MDEDELIVFYRELDVLLEDLELVARVAIEADLADAENVGLSQKFRDHREDIRREGEVFGFLGVDAQPGEMREEKFRGAGRLVLGDLAEIIAKTVNRAAIKAGPKRGFTDGDATGRDHGLIVVGGAAHHMTVGLDVAHGRRII